ncbi:hypothetical protein AVEN_142940-1 [Araneus ventricosus]|uniref:Uncharacterized protein n=1 Tax=Araneus ventricosus TaxID=182803 RepID=A0A4Y2RJ70_ARAVE|nr:hypothetical protein AVEN_142940-1 [Araneus ventricosus]
MKGEADAGSPRGMRDQKGTDSPELLTQDKENTVRFKNSRLALLDDFTTERENPGYVDFDFDNEDNGPEDDLEEIFSDHESFCEHDTESEEDGDSGNEDVNNLDLFSSKEGIEWRKTKFRQNIRCLNCVSLTRNKRTNQRKM